MRSTGPRALAFVAACVVAWPVAPARAAQTPAAALPRVYVFASPSDVTSDARDRRDAVNDVRSALGGRKKTLVLVEDEARADVLVEVLSRTTVVPRVRIGIAPPGQPGMPPGLARVAQMRVKVARKGADPVELVNKNSPLVSPGGWGSAAADLAKQIEKWIKGA